MENTMIDSVTGSVKTFRVNVFGFFVIAIAALFSMPASAGPFDKVSYTGENKSFSEYTAIYIAPVEVSLEEPANRFRRRRGNGDRPVSNSDQAQKANDLYEDLSRNVGNRFDLADNPGPGILTISTTLTELQSTRPTQADYTQEVSLNFNSVYAGGAAATFVLSENGSEVATLSDRYFGSFNDGLPRNGIWSDTDRTFSRWSRNISKFLAKN